MREKLFEAAEGLKKCVLAYQNGTPPLDSGQMKKRLGNKQFSSKENQAHTLPLVSSFTHFQNISQKISRIKFVCVTPEACVQMG